MPTVPCTGAMVSTRICTRSHWGGSQTPASYARLVAAWAFGAPQLAPYCYGAWGARSGTKPYSPIVAGEGWRPTAAAAELPFARQENHTQTQEHGSRRTTPALSSANAAGNPHSDASHNSWKARILDRNMPPLTRAPAAPIACTQATHARRCPALPHLHQGIGPEH